MELKNTFIELSFAFKLYIHCHAYDKNFMLSIFTIPYCSSWFLILCLGFLIPLENFSLIWKRHYYRWRASNLDLCWSTLMAIEQWGFFSVPHLLWHGASVNNGHLRGQATLTPAAKRLAVELPLPVLTTEVCRGWVSNTKPSACEANATAALQFKVYYHF